MADDGSTKFSLVSGGEKQELFLPAPGIHNVLNALAAVAVAEHLGVAKEKSSAALADYRPPAMRQQIVKANGITIIDDSYNASPDSMRSSIDVLQNLKGNGLSLIHICFYGEIGIIADIHANHRRVNINGANDLCAVFIKVPQGVL